MIAEASLEEVRDRTDIVEVILEYLPSLKRSGRNHKACCPFHQERTPSFMVNPDKQIFHCFGCHEGGDVFKFVMKFEGLTFPESVEKLAARAGVRVAAQRESMSPQAKERRGLYKVLELAQTYFQAHLEKLGKHAAGRVYLEKRGLTEATLQAFRLGFAPRRYGLEEAAGKKGYPPELLEKAGLLREYDGVRQNYFRDRIIFPIDNPKGEVVGFGARLLGDGEPKYLNSPETPVFSKGKVLYALKAALPAIRKAREALLLEGYMDVIAAHQFGFKNACAPLGTALTEDHAALLKRYADRVTVVFDPDIAGIKASMRGAEVLLEKGITVAIATLPEGLDPDDMLRQRGAEAFQAALENAQDVPAFKTDQLLRAVKGAPSADEKSRIAAEVLETIARTPDEILKSEWLRTLAQRLEVDEHSLYHRLKGVGAQPERKTRREPAAPGNQDVPSPLPVGERDILLYLFRLPRLAVDDELVAESDLGDARARRIFTGLRAALGEEGGDWSGRLLESLEPEAAALARELLCDDREVSDPAKILAGIVGRMRKRRRFGELEPIVLGEGDGKPVDPEIKKEYLRLLSELKGTQKGD